MNELMTITEFSEFESKMAEFKDRYDDVVYDLDVPEQNRQARSDRLAIGKVVSKLDRAHKELKAPLKERVDLIDGERKRIKDQLLHTQGKIKAQIQEHEERKQAIADALQARIDAIAGMAANDTQWTAADIKARLAEANAINPESEEYAPRQADAALAHRQIVRTLNTMLTAREKYEAEQAELARLKAEEEKRLRAERDERIRKEAEEKAKREAAELARRTAEEAAERERAIEAQKEAAKEAERLAAKRAAQAEEAHKAAIEEAKRREQELEKRAAEEAKQAEIRAKEAARLAAERAAQAERERAEAHRRKEAAEAEAARKESERKAANKAHQAKVDGDIRNDMLSINNGNSITADQMLKAIKSGSIRHVKILY